MKQIKQTVSAAHKVRVVGINKRIFNLHNVHNHLACGGQALVKHGLHYIADFALQFVVLIDFWQLNFNHNSPELLVSLISAVQRWFQESGDLLPHKHFESSFRHKQTRVHGLGVLYRSLDVQLRQVLERIDGGNYPAEHIVEDEVDAGAALNFHGRVVHKLALQLVGISIDECVYQMQY